jgi:hypothetical protein
MKKLLLSFLVVMAGMGTCVSHAEAHGYYHGGYYRGGWVAPAIIGGVIGYGMARPYYNPYYYPPVIVEQSPVIVQQPPVYIQQPAPAQNCSPWTETQRPDGTISRTRTCAQ